MAKQALTNTQKIALLLTSLGAERTAEVMGYLEPEQTATLVREITTLGKVSHQTQRTVLREFRAMLAAREQQREQTSFAEQVLEQSLAVKPAVRSAKTASGTLPYLSTVLPSRAAELLCGEPVPITALLLSTLSVECAAGILECLPAELQPRVAVQLASTTPPAPEVRAQLESALRAKATRHRQEEHLNGRAALERLVGETPTAQVGQGGGATRQAVAAPAPTSGFTFHQLETLSLPALQTVLKQVDTRDIYYALRGADHALHQQMLRAIPLTRRVVVQGYIKAQQPVRLAEISAAQERILRLAVALLNTKSRAAVKREELVHA